ncbi:MAG: hypothetical protein ACRCUB_17480, partial [Plesiomonas shigelloides]
YHLAHRPLARHWLRSYARDARASGDRGGVRVNAHDRENAHVNEHGYDHDGGYDYVYEHARAHDHGDEHENDAVRVHPLQSGLRLRRNRMSYTWLFHLYFLNS